MRRHPPLKPLAWLLAGLLAAPLAMAHGDVTPQAVDTHELPALGEPWRDQNPYRKNDKAASAWRAM